MPYEPESASKAEAPSGSYGSQEPVSGEPAIPKPTAPVAGPCGSGGQPVCAGDQLSGIALPPSLFSLFYLVSLFGSQATEQYVCKLGQQIPQQLSSEFLYCRKGIRM